MNYVRERESGTFLVAQMFFLSSKRVRDLLIPIEISPSTQSPAVKVTTEGVPREKFIQPEHHVRRQQTVDSRYLTCRGANRLKTG